MTRRTRRAAIGGGIALLAAVGVLAYGGSLWAAAGSGQPWWAEPPARQFERGREQDAQGRELDADRSDYREEGPSRPAAYLESVERIEERRAIDEMDVRAAQEELKRALEAATDGDGFAQGGGGGRAKNVILFIGDGMGVTTVAAARILQGQINGGMGEENLLFFEMFPRLAMSKVYNTNAQVPDSAGTMTAMMTGTKTKEGIIAVGPQVVRGDHTTVPGNELMTLLERAETKGLSTGIVSTARITHATPACTYAHSPERDWEADVNLSPEAKADDFPDIARQLIEFPYGDGLEVALGGGRRYFLPDSTPDPEDVGATGIREDGRNLTQEWLGQPGSAYVWDQAGFDAINPSSVDHLLGLFEASHMEYEADRHLDTAGEPSLTEMTEKAIDILDRDNQGYFLMVEAGRIDHAHHAGNAYRALTDTITFAEAIEAAAAKVDLSETLILVTADHGHVFTIAGYPTRGNDILGKVISNDETGEPAPDFARDLDGLPFTTLSYANGPGYIPGPRPDLELVDTADPDYLQEATVPLSSETHSGEDVPLYGVGKGAKEVHGTLEQDEVHDIMRAAFKRL